MNPFSVSYDTLNQKTQKQNPPKKKGSKSTNLQGERAWFGSLTEAEIPILVENTLYLMSQVMIFRRKNFWSTPRKCALRWWRSRWMRSNNGRTLNRYNLTIASLLLACLLRSFLPSLRLGVHPLWERPSLTPGFPKSRIKLVSNSQIYQTLEHYLRYFLIPQECFPIPLRSISVYQLLLRRSTHMFVMGSFGRFPACRNMADLEGRGYSHDHLEM